jgi:RHS repeat-associated protein
MDGATGLTYMQQRYYDPQVGRFLSVDPVTAYETGDMSLFNRYRYAANNPYRFVDPDGRREGSAERFSAAVSDALVEGRMHELEPLVGPALTVTTALAGATPVVGPYLSGGINALRATAPESGQGTSGISNPVPSTLARVIPDGIDANSLGAPGARDVFVTAADDIAGMTAPQIANQLTIPNSATGFRIIEFATPQAGVASPVFRMNPGFVGGGRTAGGAREFVVPNGPIPAGATIRTVAP